MFGGQPVPYHLDESNSWGLSVEELHKSLNEGRDKGYDVKALCVINPGNPTGQCLTDDSIKNIIKFCKNEKLVLLADEVYQTNTYLSHRPFHSFKKVLRRYKPLKK